MTEALQFLEDPDQGQPLPRRPARVRRKELLQPPMPGSDPWHRLPLVLMAEFRLVRPQDLAGCVPRHVRRAAYLLHRPALNVKGPADRRDRIQPIQLPFRPLPNSEWSKRTSGGSELGADLPVSAVNLACRNMGSVNLKLPRVACPFVLQHSTATAWHSHLPAGSCRTVLQLAEAKRRERQRAHVLACPGGLSF